MSSGFSRHDEVSAIFGPVKAEAYEEMALHHPGNLLMAPAVVVNASAAALQTFDMRVLGAQLAVEGMQLLAIDQLKWVMKRFIEKPLLLEQTEQFFHPAANQNDGNKPGQSKSFLQRFSIGTYELIVDRYLSPAARAWYETAAKRLYRCHLEGMELTPLVQRREVGEFDDFLRDSRELNRQGEKPGQGDPVLRERFQKLMDATIGAAFTERSNVGRQICEIDSNMRLNHIGLRMKATAGFSVEPDALSTYYLSRSQDTWDKNVSEIHRSVGVLLRDSTRMMIERSRGRASP